MTAERSPKRTAVVAGASGLIGRELVTRLLREPVYESVVALTRRRLNAGDRVIEVPAHFDNLERMLAPVVPAEASVDAYCCLGTTIRAAGSEMAFRQVDFEYVVAFGRWAAQRPVRRLVVITALGADAESRVFYNRVKGQVETALRELTGLALTIVRPSLLDGPRPEWRVGEFLALAVSRPLRGLLPARVRPVRAADVAQSMIDAAQRADAPALIESADMHGAAARADAR
jgi:uncharacterized protein YbjT (DUF2867 family)